MKNVLLFLLVFCFISLHAQDSTVTTIGPGVKYHSVTKTGPYSIKILEVDLTQPEIKIKSAVARDVLGTGFETTSSQAARNNYSGHIVLGAINGDFFGISEPTNPYSFLGSSMIKNHEFVNGVSSSRTSISFNDQKITSFEKFSFSGQVKAKNNQIINITAVNQTRYTNNMILFNKFIGANTLTNQWGVEVKLEPIEPLAINQFVKFVAVAKEDGIGSMAIGNYFVLSGHDSCARFLRNQINIGDTISLNLGTNFNKGNLATLMGGGPRLITNGVIPGDFAGLEGFDASFTDSRHPRSAVGVNKDSTKLFFVAVDGRQPSLSIGMSLTELATYMKRIGCYNALNLDGGGSTAMVVRGQVVNSPSDGSERAVGNILMAILEAPVTGLIETFELSPRTIIIDSSQTKKISVTATDHWGYPITVAASELTWQVVGINGHVDENGFFVPEESGEGIIIGTVNNISDTISVTVLTEQIPVWSFGSSAGNLPSWFSTTASTERGFAYGFVNNNHRIYLVSRPTVYILDASTGDQVSTLSTTAVSGGTYPINDIEVSDDGYIFGGNLTVNSSTTPFKIYKWNNESSEAEVVITFNGSTGRLGDKITVVGSVENNTAEIYAAVNSSNVIYKWVMNNGTFNQTPTTITLSGVTNYGTSPAVYPRGLGNSNIFVNGNSLRPTEFTSTGTQVAAAPTSVVDSRSNAMRFIESGNQKYLIVFQYGASNENAKILDISNGLGNAVSIDVTPTLGTNSNSIGTSGDIDYRYYAPGRYIYYVLSTNNGFAAYQLVNDQQLPVELINFAAEINDGVVLLKWQTATETNNRGFDIERKEENTNWNKIAFIAGAGTTSEVTNYSYQDQSALNGVNYEYRLKQLDYDGTYTYSNTILANSTLPNNYFLYQNYPNPFNPETKISYQISSSEQVKLTVYDVLGREITTLVNEFQNAGKYIYSFNASNLAGGVYIYELSTPSYRNSKKLILLK